MNRSKFEKLISASPLLAKIRFFFLEYPEWAAFAIIFGLILWLNFHQIENKFYGDAADYWQKARTFHDPASQEFSLLNFNARLRGYLFPLILYAIIKLASFAGMSDKYALQTAHALIFSGALTVIFPRLLKKLLKIELKFWQILLFGLLTIFFWRGYLYYPLSDFWAISVFILGLYVFLYYGDRGWALFLTGLCFGGMTLIRPSYLIALIFLLILCPIYFYKTWFQTKKRLLVSALIFALGLALVFFPQLWINFKTYGELNPLPQARMPNGASLFLKQLTWGIQIQQGIAIVGGQNSGHPSLTPAYFMDQHGRNLLVRSGFALKPFLTTDPLTLSEYLRLVYRHPLDFLIIYARHFFNGLDIVYVTPYVVDLDANTIHVRLFNYSLWFLALIYINKRLKFSDMISYPFAFFTIFALPSLMSIPGAVEVRLMLPFYFALYAIVAFFALPEFFSLTGSRKKDLLLRYLPWYGAFLMTCLLLSINAYTGLEYGESRVFYIFW